MDIIVDPRFRDKIPKPCEEERRRLEENILADGLVREPLVLWKGTNILVDGHNRWDIIQKHPEIPYSTIEREFDNEWDVIAWICRNQLGRRNISKVVYDKLIQEEHDAIQRIPGGDHKSDGFKKQIAQNAQFENTRETVAKEHGITPAYVERAVEFGRGLDAAEAVAPGFKEAVLSGTESYPKRNIAGLRKIEDEAERKEAVEEMRNPKVKFPSNRGGSRSRKPTDEELAIEEADRRTTDKNAVRTPHLLPIENSSEPTRTNISIPIVETMIPTTLLRVTFSLRSAIAKRGESTGEVESSASAIVGDRKASYVYVSNK